MPRLAAESTQTLAISRACLKTLQVEEVAALIKAWSLVNCKHESEGSSRLEVKLSTVCLICGRSQRLLLDPGSTWRLACLTTGNA